ncbi:MAG TPA: beta-propeller fold lactonase family protein, partial [Ideonella sp.]|nr:beta-propeller fold lactonase family protein [Ideonella sp.]
TRRRFGLSLIAAAAAAASAAVPAWARQGSDPLASQAAGHVYTSTNSPTGNELLVYTPQADGSLALTQRVSTQGLGTGAGLGSQGAVTLSTDRRHLFVVNAASNTVATLSLKGGQAVLKTVVASGGMMPTSVAEHDGLVYVMNASGDGNVAGFRNHQGELRPLADGLRGLSAAGGTGPGQVGFDPSGDVLVVTERTSNRLSSWQVRHNGSLGNIVVTPSSGTTPFGFAFDLRDHLVVSEAFAGAAGASAASSYRLAPHPAATPTLLSASVPTTQTSACWLVIAPNGRHAYTANAGSSTISSFRVKRSGRLELAQAVAGNNGVDAGATDLAMTDDGRRLYALASRSLQIVAYRPDGDGGLEMLGAATGLPLGSVGIAAD